MLVVDKMKAAISERYGPPEVVELRRVSKPIPKSDEILIKICATTVTRTDSGMRTPYPLFACLFIGMFKPKITNLGLDFAGLVEVAGNDVEEFKSGDRVFGMSPDTYGAHAEYICIPAKGSVTKIPAGIDFTDAVLCEGAWYANSNLEKYNIQTGDHVMIFGGGGAIG